MARIGELWREWLDLFDRGDSAQASSSIARLAVTAEELGIRGLPDLAAGAAARALTLSAKGERQQAHAALEVARRLDAEAPEVDLAAAAVARSEGRRLAALGHEFSALRRALSQAHLRRLLGLDTALWLLGMVALAAAFFLVVQMAAKGGGLWRDVTRLVSRLAPGRAGYALALGLLIWPLFLPHGLLWLALYWAVLLWGYGSLSERLIFLALFGFLGGAPVVLDAIRRDLVVQLSPPVQALHALMRDRLYGNLATDLGLLAAQLPEDPALWQLTADVHRRLGQWDKAEALYRQVLQKEPNRVGALLNLGAYAVSIGDRARARELFKRAEDAGPTDAAAAFNQHLLLLDEYHFDEGKAALERAQAIDPARVSEWLRTAEESGYRVSNEGRDRIPEILRSISAQDRTATRSSARAEGLRRWFTPLAAIGLALLALALHAARSPFGYSDPPLVLTLERQGPEPWLRVLVPGLQSAELGEGFRAFGQVMLPAVLLSLLWGGRFTFSLPLWLPMSLSLPGLVGGLGLLLVLGVRLGAELLRRRRS